MNARSALVLASLLLPASIATAAGPGNSLDRCQATVATETTRYVADVTKNVGRCLDAISNSVVGGGTPVAAAASKNAKVCAAKLVKLRNTSKPDAQLDLRLRTKIASSCDPAVNPKLLHSEGSIWTVGSRTLGAANLASFCRAAGGSTSLSSLEDWQSCLVAVADCQARQAIALRWPRALEYFAALEPALEGLPPTPETADALAALRALDDALEGTKDDDVPELTCAPSVGLLATGQTQCDQGDGTFGPCPGPEPGQDGEVQAGAPARFTDNGDGTITDHATGLMWEKNSRDTGVNDADGADGSWFLAGLRIARTQGGIADHPFNLSTFLYDDWRAPNRRELESLVDLSRHHPAIDPIFHHDCVPGCTIEECSCTASDLYWTSSPADESTAWAVSFADGSVVPVDRGQTLRVRGVRGGTPNYVLAPGTPHAKSIDVKSPWKQDCLPVTLIGYDTDAGCVIGAQLLTLPQNGFLTHFISAFPSDCIEPVGDFHLAGQGHHRYAQTLCYVTFSPTFTGTDAFTYRVVDRQGNVSATATATITVFQVP